MANMSIKYQSNAKKITDRYFKEFRRAPTKKEFAHEMLILLRKKNPQSRKFECPKCKKISYIRTPHGREWWCTKCNRKLKEVESEPDTVTPTPRFEDYDNGRYVVFELSSGKRKYSIMVDPKVTRMLYMIKPDKTRSFVSNRRTINVKRYANYLVFSILSSKVRARVNRSWFER